MMDGMKEPDRPGGLTLDDAWKTYASRELRKRYLALKSLCPPPWDQDRIELMEGDESYLDTQRGMAFVAFNSVWQAVWADLVRQLAAGELVGFVFEEHPIGLESTRRRVPAGMWRRAEYLGDGVNIFGRIYRDVRVWRAADLKDVDGSVSLRGDDAEPVVARRKMDFKVLVPIVASETPAAAAILDDPNPPHGAVRDAVLAMAQDARLAGAEEETIKREFQKIRPKRKRTRKPD